MNKDRFNIPTHYAEVCPTCQCADCEIIETGTGTDVWECHYDGVCYEG